MDLGDIFSLGSFGLDLFSHAKSRKAYRKQENSYNQQAELNRQIGAFNAEVAERTGEETVYAIVQETKKLLGKQIVEFSNRGIELEGSPMLVLGETATMGKAEAQNAYFNAQVNKINYQFGALGATATARNAAEQAKYGAMSSMVNMMNSVKDGYNLMRSMFKSSTLNSSDLSSSVRSSNSTIDSLLLSRLGIK